jgi:subtilase family serine protease
MPVNQPDLVISGWSAVVSVIPGADFNFSYFIENIGGAAAPGASAAAYYVDQKPDTGHFLGYNVTNPLASLATQTVSGGFSTAGLSVGQHTLWIGADNWNQVAESDETDNFNSITFTVEGPDLFVFGVSAPASVTQGADFTFNYKVQNGGPFASGASAAAYYVDGMPDTGHFLGYDTTGPLGVGQATPALGGGFSTAGLSVGQHTLWIRADNWSQVTEQDETNNLISVQFTVAAPPQPDLVVANIVPALPSVAQGAAFNFSYVIQNVGGVPATVSSGAAYYVDQMPDTGHFLGYNVTSPLSSGGGFQTLNGGFSTAGLSVGQHTLWVDADNWGQVAEGNETNNFRSITFTVTAPPQPDLIVSVLTVPISVVQGAAYNFTYTIANQGTAAAAASGAAYYVDQMPDTAHFLGDGVVNPLTAGQSQNFAGGFSTAGLSVGQHTIWVGADNWGQVAEGNEANNFQSLTFNVTAPPQPDLTVTVSGPVSVVQGNAFTFNYLVQNGGLAAAGLSAAAYYVDQKPDTAHFLGDGVINSLAAGGGTQSFIGNSFSTAGLSVGQHTLWVDADNWGQVAESNETNNFTPFTFTVTAPPRPDLFVFSVTGPLSVAQGADFTFTYKVQNGGTATAAASGAAYYVDGMPDTGHFLGYDVIGALGVGQATPSLGGGFNTAGLSVGQHTLWIGADNWGQVAESDETDNLISVPFTVTAPPGGMAGSITAGASANQGVPARGALDTALLGQYMAAGFGSSNAGGAALVAADPSQTSNTNPLLAPPHA